jgi:hypothetical protein
LLSPWSLLFLALVVALVFPVGLAIRFGMGWSNESIPVFSLNAAMSGILADQILRHVWGVTLLVSQRPRMAFVWFWLALMLLLAAFGPVGLNEIITGGRG